MASWQVLSLWSFQGGFLRPKFLTIHHQSSRCFPIFPSAHRQAMGGNKGASKRTKMLGNSKSPGRRIFCWKNYGQCVFSHVFTSFGKTYLEKLDKKEEKLWCFLWFACFYTWKNRRFVLNKISLSRHDFSGNSTFVDGKDPFMPSEWPLRLIASMSWRLGNRLH